MNHRDAEHYVVDFAEGVLDGRLLGDLTLHVQGCSECQEWLDTFDFLANSVDRSGGGEHPDSHLIALCAVRAEEEFEPDRSDLHQHLETCSQCRQEVELIKTALYQARPEGESKAPPRKPVSAGQWWKAAAAAALLGIAITALLGPSLRHGEQPVDVSPMIASTALAEPGGGPGLPVTEFAEAEINGKRLIESDGSLTFTETKINEGAVVTIHATQTVAFGNGFEIGPQTRVEVGVRPEGKNQGVSKPKGGRNSTG